MIKKKLIYKFLVKWIHFFGNNYIRIYKNTIDLKIDFLVGPFLTKKCL